MPHNGEWNPFSTKDWADAIGLVNIPLFGGEQPRGIAGDFAVLLDGRRSSFGLFLADDPNELIYSNRPLSWSWSANLRHSLIVHKKADVVIHRRWDSPDKSTKFPIPRTSLEAATAFAERIGSAKARSASDVIGRMLGAFRRVRANLAPQIMDAVVAIRVFNAFLVGAEMVRKGSLRPDEWRGCRTVKDALDLIKNNDDGVGVDRIPSDAASIEIGGLPGTFIDPDPSTGCELEPDLLIRHASGSLYQDAHFELEREDQLSLPGLAENPSYQPSLQRDARFTQPALARAMVQQALKAYRRTEREREMVILDPACGSGVFLQHALQELAATACKRAIKLIGFDTSAVSCAISEFCLHRSARDAALRDLRVTTEISDQNAMRRMASC